MLVIDMLIYWTSKLVIKVCLLEQTSIKSLIFIFKLKQIIYFNILISHVMLVNNAILGKAFEIEWVFKYSELKTAPILINEEIQFQTKVENH